MSIWGVGAGFIVTNQGAFHKSEGKFLRPTIVILLLVGSASETSCRLAAQEPQAGYGLAASGQSPDAILVETLINDGLPSIALRVCESRMPLHELGSDAHTKWRMLALQAQTAVALQDIDFANGEDGIAAIEHSLEALAADAKGTPRGAWVQWKKLWCRWYVLQRALAAYLAVPSREPLRDAIIIAIRSVLDEVELLEQELRAAQPPKGTIVTPSQRLDLRGSLDLLKADLLYQRSQCYPIASDDRIAAASEMLGSLELALSKLPGDWTHRPALSIAKAKAQVQLEQYDAALTNLHSLWKQLQESSNTSAETMQHQRTIAAVAARAARELERWDDFDTWLARGGGANAIPELALESFASEMKRGGDDAAERALKLKRDIGTRFGPYWEQRADAILISSGGFDPNSTNPTGNASLEVLRIEVRQLLAAKRWNDAIQKLEQAELAAVRVNADSEAFAFAMQRAAIFESKGQRENASSAFFQAATQHSMQPKAPAAALMSAWLIRSPEPNADTEKLLATRATYRERLIDTALLWPTSEAATQASLWLEQELLSRDDILAWITFWNKKCQAHPEPATLFSPLAARVALLYLITKDDWFEPGIVDPKELENARQSLRQTLSSIAPAANRIAIDAWLATLKAEHRWAPTNLSAPIDAAPNDPFGQIALRWLACERASEFAWNEASPDRAAAIERMPNHIAALEAILAPPSDATQPSIGLGPGIDARLQQSIAYYRAAVAGSKSDLGPSIAELAKRQEENKKSLGWLYRTARAMQTSATHRDQAIRRFRQMANGVPAGSEPWLEARARTAQTLRLQGDDTAANQLRDLVFATYPSAEATWRVRFESK